MKTAQEYRNEAAELHNRVEESFERCDTDGFLSQWANGISANVASLNAEIAENGGMSSFPGLYRRDNNQRVPAKIITIRDKFNYGNPKGVWALVDESTGRFTGFVPVGANSRKQKQLGFYEKDEMAPAIAKIVGTGRGLSGNAWAAVVRIDRGW